MKMASGPATIGGELPVKLELQSPVPTSGVLGMPPPRMGGAVMKLPTGVMNNNIRSPGNLTVSMNPGIRIQSPAGIVMDSPGARQPLRPAPRGAAADFQSNPPPSSFKVAPPATTSCESINNNNNMNTNNSLPNANKGGQHGQPQPGTSPTNNTDQVRQGTS